ncbi:hypothetical protein N826_25620 [Skermanella aerolata KACC 11604]|nr:hypothetical protein N826_25620 [Skermanella aerolata KACC 11604]
MSVARELVLGDLTAAVTGLSKYARIGLTAALTR